MSLCIRIKIADKCQVIFEDKVRGKIVKKESTLSRDRLKSVCEPLRPALEKFQSGFIALQERPARAVGEALLRLHFEGRQILYALFDDDDEKLDEAAQMCRDACPNWQQPGWDPNSFAPQVIEVRTFVDYGLPIDLLPILHPFYKPKDTETMDDVARIAGTFLGFSAIVRRIFAGTGPGTRLHVENTGSFPLKMFWDGDLPGAKNARTFFEENNAHFDLKGGPWPNGAECSDANLFCEQAANYLGDSGTSFDSDARHRPDQLCYFFCHCDTSAKNSGDYLLYFARGGWPRREQAVKLRNLRDELHLRNREPHRRTAPRPLVFLNACGSASLDPSAATSFPDLFLKMGFLGFIGTEATVPDAFGSLFAEVFFRHFVGGLPLGRALHAARWHMLRKHSSPLGILYTLFADAEIEVRSKVESLRAKLLDRSARLAG